MQIGEVIRKYRKSKNMTQEDMAKRLGVTGPAVNKWENGNSFPDISLLAPIARLLGISLDTLLSFREELTMEEINHFVLEMDAKLKEESYEQVFHWTKGILEKYPNCPRLIWQMALILDSWQLTKGIPDTENYEGYILECYVRALESEDEDIRSGAADSLFGFYLRKEEYGKAEEYLAYFAKQNPERKRKQAVICSKTNRVGEAYKAYEELLFSGYQMMNMVFQSLYMLAMEDGDREKAHMLVEKQRVLAGVFDMGKYHETSCRLDLATAERDADTVVDTMEEMMSSVGTMGDFCRSPLYEHVAFRELRPEFLEDMKRNLKKCFRDEETYGFLMDDERWQELVR